MFPLSYSFEVMCSVLCDRNSIEKASIRQGLKVVGSKKEKEKKNQKKKGVGKIHASLNNYHFTDCLRFVSLSFTDVALIDSSGNITCKFT